MRSKLERIFERIFAVYSTIQILCLVAITVLMFGQVIVREVFNYGVQWVYELSCMLQVTMVWLGLPSLLYRGENISISVLYDVVPPLMKRILDVLTYLIILSSVAMISYGYVLYMQKLAFTKSPAMRMPNYLFFGAFPFGIIMIIFVLIFKTEEMLKLRKQPETEAGEVE